MRIILDATLESNRIHPQAMNAREALGRLAALIMGEEALAARLNGIGTSLETAPFAEALMQCATAHGIALSPEELAAYLRPDPLGLARWAAPAVQGKHWPPPAWLPFQVVADADGIHVDWTYFGSAPLSEPFFEDSIRRALRAPFARLFRYRMALDDFVGAAEIASSLKPAGLIFHMSRCGSTLAAQMLAAVVDNIVVSEAAPIDAIVQLDLPMAQRAPLLAAMIAAYGRRRAGHEQRLVIKLDSWHTLALPLFRRALPNVPWVFLYRDPVEVLVSQMRRRGTQMVPQFVPPAFYGLSEADGVLGEDYCARVLARICGTAQAHLGDGGLAINYSALPDAVFTTMLPHFGVPATAAERAAMLRATQQDVKAPLFAFAPDSAAKQREASAALRDASERHLGEIYRALEGMRT